MRDRVPTHPGRVRLVPVAGQDNLYDLVRADDAITEGMPLCKATLLPDSVCDALGIDREESTPADALLALKRVTKILEKTVTGEFKNESTISVQTGVDLAKFDYLMILVPSTASVAGNYNYQVSVEGVRAVCFDSSTYGRNRRGYCILSKIPGLSEGVDSANSGSVTIFKTFPNTVFAPHGDVLNLGISCHTYETVKSISVVIYGGML